MPALPRFRRSLLALSGVLATLVVPASATGLSATAVYTATADASTPGLYDYALTLNNTGTTTVGTFWFAWVPGGDFLSPAPAEVSSPSGWTLSRISNAATGGTSLRWVDTVNPLQPGQSLSGFTFESLETPDQLLGTVPSGVGAGDPILTSFVYSGAPFSDAGSQFVATAATPEPSSLILLATGLLGAAGGARRRFGSAARA